MQRYSHRPGRETCAGRVLLEGRPVQIPDCEADPEYKAPDVLRVGGNRAILGVPLLREGLPIGVLTLTRSTTRPFTEKQIELATTFADQAVIAIENVRLFEEVQARTRDLSESLQQQTATADVLKVISRSTFDLQTVLDTLTESAARLCDADMAGIARQRQDGTAFHHVTSYNFPPDWVEYNKTLHVEPGRGSVIGRVLLSRKAVQVADVLADPEYTYFNTQKKAGFRTFLGVPLLREGIPIGVIMLGRKTVTPFTAKQIDLVTTFADQAVIAIENVRLFDEVQARTRELSESLEQQTATSEVLRVISSSPSELEPVFQAMLKNATRICGAKFGMMYRIDDGLFHIAATLGTPPALADFFKQRGSFVPEAGVPLDRLLRTKKLVHTIDLAVELIRPRSADLGGARSHIAVPMLKENQLIGAISIYRQEVRPFTDKQIELVENFAAQAVIAIENTRLLNELRESLQQQTATSEVLKVISRSTFDLHTVLQTLVESAARLC